MRRLKDVPHRVASPFINDAGDSSPAPQRLSVTHTAFVLFGLHDPWEKPATSPFVPSTESHVRCHLFPFVTEAIDMSLAVSPTAVI